MKRPIYLDYQATTPMAPEAREAMRPYLEERFGNPHSPHLYGREAAAAVELARDRVASVIDVPPQEVIFTSGATEAVNLAIKGGIAAAVASGAPPRLITLATEHACVLESAEWLRGLGTDVVILPVDSRGIVDLDAARQALSVGAAMISVCAVNNEIGVVQPLTELAHMARDAGALVHVDAAQAFGKTALDPADHDLMSISAHKIYGPKGIGALRIARGVKVQPLLHGGGQEGQGVRSGTLAPALCAGFGAAALVAKQAMATDALHIRALWDMALEAMEGEYRINGSVDRRYHGNLNMELPGVDAARLISEVRGVAFSAASACASGSGRPSHVLSALGLDERRARSSIRIGFGRYTSKADVQAAIGLINAAIGAQRMAAS